MYFYAYDTYCFDCYCKWYPECLSWYDGYSGCDYCVTKKGPHDVGWSSVYNGTDCSLYDHGEYQTDGLYGVWTYKVLNEGSLESACATSTISPQPVCDYWGVSCSYDHPNCEVCICWCSPYPIGCNPYITGVKIYRNGGLVNTHAYTLDEKNLSYFNWLDTGLTAWTCYCYDIKHYYTDTYGTYCSTSACSYSCCQQTGPNLPPQQANFYICFGPLCDYMGCCVSCYACFCWKPPTVQGSYACYTVRACNPDLYMCFDYNYCCGGYDNPPNITCHNFCWNCSWGQSSNWYFKIDIQNDSGCTAGCVVGPLNLSSVHTDVANGVTYTETPTGGALASGSGTYNITSTKTPTGGALASGSAVIVKTYTETPASGVLANGSGTYNITSTKTPTGGTLASGNATNNITSIIIPSDGISIGGEAIVAVFTIYLEIPTGGIITNGIATRIVMYNISTSGGVVVDGNVETSSIFTEIPEGGILLYGEAESSSSRIYVEIPEGGMKVSGIADALYYAMIEILGGVSVNGNLISSVSTFNTTTGGIEMGGKARIIPPRGTKYIIFVGEAEENTPLYRLYEIRRTYDLDAVRMPLIRLNALTD